MGMRVMTREFENFDKDRCAQDDEEEKQNKRKKNQACRKGQEREKERVATSFLSSPCLSVGHLFLFSLHLSRSRRCHMKHQSCFLLPAASSSSSLRGAFQRQERDREKCCLRLRNSHKCKNFFSPPDATTTTTSYVMLLFAKRKYSVSKMTRFSLSSLFVKL